MKQLPSSKSTLYKKTHSRQVPFYKPFGKKIFFKNTDLENIMLGNRQEIGGAK